MFKDQEFKDTRRIILDNDRNQVNTGHMEIMKTIEGTDPKFAKHMFLRNKLLENFAKHMGGGVNILDQPMCNHCERPAAWDLNGTAYCFACHTKTNKPITVRKYLIEYTKGLSEETLEILTMQGGDEIDIIK